MTESKHQDTSPKSTDLCRDQQSRPDLASSSDHETLATSPRSPRALLLLQRIMVIHGGTRRRRRRRPTSPMSTLFFLPLLLSLLSAVPMALSLSLSSAPRRPDSAGAWLTLPVLLDIQPMALRLDVTRPLAPQLAGFCRTHGLDPRRCHVLQDAVAPLLRIQVPAASASAPAKRSQACRPASTPPPFPAFAIIKSLLVPMSSAATAPAMNFHWVQDTAANIATDVCGFVSSTALSSRDDDGGIDGDESCLEALAMAIDGSFEWLRELPPCTEEDEDVDYLSVSLTSNDATAESGPRSASFTISERVSAVEDLIASFMASKRGDPVMDTTTFEAEETTAMDQTQALNETPAAAGDDPVPDADEDEESLRIPEPDDLVLIRPLTNSLHAIDDDPSNDQVVEKSVSEIDVDEHDRHPATHSNAPQTTDKPDAQLNTVNADGGAVDPLQQRISENEDLVVESDDSQAALETPSEKVPSADIEEERQMAPLEEELSMNSLPTSTTIESSGDASVLDERGNASSPSEDEELQDVADARAGETETKAIADAEKITLEYVGETPQRATEMASVWEVVTMALTFGAIFVVFYMVLDVVMITLSYVGERGNLRDWLPGGIKQTMGSVVQRSVDVLPLPDLVEPNEDLNIVEPSPTPKARELDPSSDAITSQSIVVASEQDSEIPPEPPTSEKQVAPSTRLTIITTHPRLASIRVPATLLSPKAQAWIRPTSFAVAAMSLMAGRYAPLLTPKAPTSLQAAGSPAMGKLQRLLMEEHLDFWIPDHEASPIRRFRLNRAARRIQKTWRRHQADRSTRRIYEAILATPVTGKAIMKDVHQPISRLYGRPGQQDSSRPKSGSYRRRNSITTA